jgi:predicted negative regulator of RcsB-dependent stress response
MYSRRCPIGTYKRLPRGKKKSNDEFRDWTIHALIWMRKNWKGVAEFTGALIVVISVLFIARGYWQHHSTQAGEELFQASSMEAGSSEQIEKLSEVVEGWPRTASGKRAMMMLGGIYLQQKNYDKAQEMFTMLAGRTRSFAMLEIAALHRLAETQLASGDAEGAANTYIKAAADPHNLVSLDSRIRAAACLEKAENFEKAAVLYKQVVTDAGETDQNLKDESEERLIWLMADGKIKG